MSVLIFVDHADGIVKKNSLEALSYGAKLAAMMGTEANGLLLGTINADPAGLGKYGIKKMYHVADTSLNQLDAQVFSEVIGNAVTQTQATSSRDDNSESYEDDFEEDADEVV
jgi:electron transfer flavoprotein alpha subunit